MILDLIAHQRFRTGRDRLLDQRYREVRDADVAGHAELFDVSQSAHRLR
jgi:hypothetical protein